MPTHQRGAVKPWDDVTPSILCFAVEAKSLAEGPAEGGCCGGSSSAAPAPPLVSPGITLEQQQQQGFINAEQQQQQQLGFTSVDLCQHGEDICLTACEGDMEEMSGQDPHCEDMQRRDQRLPFRIFPDPAEVALGPEATYERLDQDQDQDQSQDQDQDEEKEHLPSIVVEPTELSEVESGELRWPPPETNAMEQEEEGERGDQEEEEEDEEEEEGDEEDLFLEQCIPPANIADWGEEEEEEQQGTSVILNQQPGLTLIDLQTDAFRDNTPTLPPSSAPAFN